MRGWVSRFSVEMHRDSGSRPRYPGVALFAIFLAFGLRLLPMTTAVNIRPEKRLTGDMEDFMVTRWCPHLCVDALDVHLAHEGSFLEAKKDG